MGSDWTHVPWERSVLRRVLNLLRDCIWYCLYEMFCSIYLLLSIEYWNTNFCTTVCVLWSFEVGYLVVCVLYSFPLWAWIILPVVGWERRIIVPVNCFMCMLVLVLRIAYSQVVLLRIVLNFVAWQLKKASKCSVVVYTLSLVIWITFT
jgi:hypothetical protein